MGYGCDRLIGLAYLHHYVMVAQTVSDSKGVPRRTRPFLFLNRFFPYIASGLFFSAIAVSLLSDIRWIIASALVAMLIAMIFWKSFFLNPEIQRSSHPHNSYWNNLDYALLPIAKLIHKAKKTPHLFVAIVWMSINLIILLALPNLQETIAVQSWLMYLPVLWLSSWIIERKSSNWFLALYLFSSALYSYLILRSFDISLRLVASQVFWLLLIGGSMHFLLRKFSEFKVISRVSYDLSEKLRNSPKYVSALEPANLDSSPAKDLNELATFIGSQLGYQGVYIFLANHKRDTICLKGTNIMDNTSWPPEWPLAGVDGKSIIAWVIRNKSDHLCRHTDFCDLYYEPKGTSTFFGAKTEATVPIMAGNECVGALDIESRQPFAFGQTDVKFLWQVANALGNALTHKREIKKQTSSVYDLFGEISYQLAFSKDLQQALDVSVERIREIFQADLVTFYQHAIGSKLPLPEITWSGEPVDKEFLMHAVGTDTLITRLIQENRTEFYEENADSSELTLGPGDGEYTKEEQASHNKKYRFIKREGIKSSAFIRLGFSHNQIEEDDVIGSLFLNYRTRQTFTSEYKKQLKAVAALLSLALFLHREVQRNIGSFTGSAPLSHSKAQTAITILQKAFEEVDKSRPEHSIEKLSQALERLKKNWANLMIAETENIAKGLRPNMAQLEAKVTSLFPVSRLVHSIDPSADMLPISIQELLYKLISEAVANALFHGNAMSIMVNVKCNSSSIGLDIKNDGLPITPERLDDLNNLDRLNPNDPYLFKKVKKPFYGMKALLIDGKRWFNLHWKFSSANKETQIKITIPFLPFLYGEQNGAL